MFTFAYALMAPFRSALFVLDCDGLVGWMAQGRHDMWETHNIKDLWSAPRTIFFPSELCKLFVLEILSCPLLKNVLCRSVRAIR